MKTELHISRNNTPSTLVNKNTNNNTEKNIPSTISPYQKLSKLRGENLAPLFCQFL
jgi:hypothetical protein